MQANLENWAAVKMKKISYLDLSTHLNSQSWTNFEIDLSLQTTKCQLRKFCQLVDLILRWAEVDLTPPPFDLHFMNID